MAEDNKGKSLIDRIAEDTPIKTDREVLAAGNLTGITPTTAIPRTAPEGKYQKLHEKMKLNLFGDRVDWDSIGYANQTLPEMAWNTFAGGAVNTLAGIIAAMGTNDFRGMYHTAMENTDKNYNNLLFRTAQELMDYTQNKFSIYQDPNQSIWNIAYWASQFQMFGYTAGIVAETFAEQALLALATKGLGNIAGAGSVASKFSKLSRLATNPVAFGSFQGIKETYLNSMHTGADVYDDLISRGKTHEEASKLANEAATYNFRVEALPMMAMNALQWTMLAKATPFFPKGKFDAGASGFFGKAIIEPLQKSRLGKAVKNPTAQKLLFDYGGQSLSEGFEEVFQETVQKYAANSIEEEAGKKSMYDVLFSDYGLRDAGIGGMLGGGLFRLMGGRFKYRGKSSNAKAKEESADKFVSNMFKTTRDHFAEEKQAREEGDLDKADTLRYTHRRDILFQALQHDIEIGSEKVFDAYVSQIEKIREDLQDPEAIKNLGLSKEDVEFFQNQYDTFLDEATRTKETFIKNWEIYDNDTNAALHITSLEMGIDFAANRLKSYEARINTLIDEKTKDLSVDGRQYIKYRTAMSTLEWLLEEPTLDDGTVLRLTTAEKNRYNKLKDSFEQTYEDIELTESDYQQVKSFFADGDAMIEISKLQQRANQAYTSTDKARKDLSNWKDADFRRRKRNKEAIKILEKSENVEEVKAAKEFLNQNESLTTELEERFDARIKELEVAEKNNKVPTKKKDSLLDMVADEEGDVKGERRSATELFGEEGQEASSLFQGEEVSSESIGTEEKTQEQIEKEDEQSRHEKNVNESADTIAGIVDPNITTELLEPLGENEADQAKRNDIGAALGKFMRKVGDRMSAHNAFVEVMEAIAERVGLDALLPHFDMFVEEFEKVTNKKINKEAARIDLFETEDDILSRIFGDKVRNLEEKAVNKEKLPFDQDKSEVTEEIESHDRTRYQSVNAKRISPNLAGGHLSIKYDREFVENGDNSITIIETDTTDELNVGGKVHPHTTMDPDKLNAGEVLEVRIPDNVDEVRIDVFDEKGEVTHRNIKFGEWRRLEEVNLTEDDDAYWDMVPMFAYRANDEVGFMVRDLAWINHSTVGKGHNPQEHNRIIKQSKKNHKRIRNNVKNSPDKKVTVQVTEKRMGTFVKLEEEISLNAADPTAFIGVYNSNGEIMVGNEPFENENRKLLNRKAMEPGTPVHIRRGPTKDTYLAFRADRPVIDDQVATLIETVLEAFAYLNHNQDSVEYKWASQIMEDALRITGKGDIERGLNLNAIKSLETFLKHFVTFETVPSNVVQEEGEPISTAIAKAVAKKRGVNNPYIFSYNSKIYVGVNDKYHIINSYGDPTKKILEKIKHISNIIRGTEGSNSNGVKLSYFLGGINTGVPTVVTDRNTGRKSLENSDQTYNEYLGDRLTTNVKGYNIGTESNPKYATIIQPTIEYAQIENDFDVFKRTGEIRQTAIDDIINKEETDQPLSETEKLMAESARETIDAQKEEIKTSENLIEEAIDLLFGDLTVSERTSIPAFQKYQIASFMVNNIIGQFQDNEKINKKEVLKKVKAAYKKEVGNRVKKIRKISKDLKALNSDNTKVKKVIEKLDNQIKQFDEVAQNWKEIERLALDSIAKTTEIVEAYVDEVETRTGRQYDKEVLEESGMKSSSYRLKRFLHGVVRTDSNGKTVRGFLGVPIYVDFEEVFETVGGLMASGQEVNSSYEEMLSKLEESKGKITWLQQVIDKLENGTGQNRNEFMYNFVKHAMSMKFVMFSQDKTGGWVLKTHDTNSSEVVRDIIKQWESLFRASDLVVNKDGENSINIDRAKDLLREFNRIKTEDLEEYHNAEKALTQIKSIYKELGLPISEIDSLGRTPEYSKIMTLAAKNEAVLEAMRNNELEVEDRLIDSLSDWISDNSFGISMHRNTIRNMIRGEFQYQQQNRKGKTTLNFKASINSSGATGNIFAALAGHLESLISEGNTSFDENTTNNPFSKNYNLLRNLATEEAKHASFMAVTSFRDAGKTLYGFTKTKHASDVTKDLKHNAEFRDQLKAKEYNKNSYLLNLLSTNSSFQEMFWMDHLGLTAFKEYGKKVWGDNGITDLPSKDHELTKLGLFQSMTGESISSVGYPNLRIVRMFFPTLSDKSQMLMLKTAALDLQTEKHIKFEQDGSVSVTQELINFVYSQLVKPEVDRIYEHATNIKNTNIKGYDDGASFFYAIPELNNILHDGHEERIITLIKESPEIYDRVWFEEKVRTAAEHILERFLLQNIENKIESWIGDKIASRDAEGNLKVNIMNKKYLDSKFGHLTDHQKVIAAAWDFQINSLVTHANIHMLYIGDPALYFPGKAKKFFINGNTTMPKPEYGNNAYNRAIQEEINVNIEKRLAAMLAPGNKIANSRHQEYLQIFIEDQLEMASNIEKYIELFYSKSSLKDTINYSDDLSATVQDLIDMYRNGAITSELKEDIGEALANRFPKISHYFNIEATDAQELTTLSEHIHILYSKGELSDEMYQSIREKILRQKEAEAKGEPIPKDTHLTEEELDGVIKPIKPVYTGFYNDKINNAMRFVYIKSSSYPLIPQLTQGHANDGLRKLLESKEILDVEGRAEMPVRASFQTANKVGSTNMPLRVFNPDGSFRDELLLPDVEEVDGETINRGNTSALNNASLVLSRDNFRIQQESPETFESTRTTLVSQAMKLIMGNGINNPNLGGFMLHGNPYSGAEITDFYNEAFSKYLSTKNRMLLERLGFNEKGEMENPERTIQVLQDVLYNEAKSRGYSQQSIDSLEITPIRNSNKEIVDFEFKLPLWMSPNSDRFESLLNSIVSNTLVSLRLPGRSYILGTSTGYKFATMDENGNIPGIENSEIVYTDSFNGALQDNQIIIAPNYRDNNGDIIYFIYEDGSINETYVERREDGSLRLKEGSIDPELLSRPSFRIPNSGHESMSQMEIVGFLPPKLDLLMIVPPNLVAQKGFDFDVDEEHMYGHHTYIDDNGNIRKFDSVAADGIIDRILISDLHNLEEGDNLANLIENMLGIPFERIQERYLDSDRGIEKFTKLLLDSMQIKIYENYLVDLHSSVLSNQNPVVQRKILSGITTKFAEKQADLIQEKLNSERNYKGFSPYDSTFQSENLVNASNGKNAIGSYSVNVTFHSLAQQIFGRGEEITLTETDKNGKTFDLSFSIGNVRTKGVLGNIKTLMPKFTEERASQITRETLQELSSEIADEFSERQNTATDDVKLRVLSRVNINNHTIGVDNLLTLLGFSRDLLSDNKTVVSIPYLLLSQPIIKDFVNMMKESESQTNDFDPARRENIIKQLGKNYGIEIKADTKRAGILTGQRMFNNLTTPESVVQKAAIELFLFLDSYSKSLGAAQSLLNINSGGLGKSFMDVIEMKLALEDLVEGNDRFSNLEKLVGEVLTASQYAARFGIPIEEIRRRRTKTEERRKREVRKSKNITQEIYNALQIGKQMYSKIDLDRDIDFVIPEHMRKENKSDAHFEVDNTLTFIAPNIPIEFFEEHGMDLPPANEYRLLKVNKSVEGDYTYDVALVDENGNYTVEKVTTNDSLSFYIDNETGKYFRRVTQNMYGHITDQEVQESEFLTPSSIIGTKIDNMVRDFFSGVLKPFGEYAAINTKKEYDNFVNQLKEFQEKLEARGETVFSDDLLVFDQRQGFAGTVDLLTIDKNNNVRIYDMKTMKTNKFDHPYSGRSTPRFFEAFNEGELSDAEKYQRQLSSYAYAIKNTFGFDVVEIGIIPIKIDYKNRAAISTGEARIEFGENDNESRERGFYKLDILDSFETLTGQEIGFLDEPTHPFEGNVLEESQQEPVSTQNTYRGLPIIESSNIINAEGQRGAARYNRDTGEILVDRKLLKQKFEEKAWTKMRDLVETIPGEGEIQIVTIKSNQYEVDTKKGTIKNLKTGKEVSGSSSIGTQILNNVDWDVVDSKVVNSKAKNLPAELFQTYEQFEAFVIEHEYQHSIYPRETFDKENPGKTKGDYETAINNRAIKELTRTGVLGGRANIDELFSPMTTSNVEIKEGVEELFNENPELANSVYEAIGFGQDTNELLDVEKREEYGLEKLRPTYRGTTLKEWENIKDGKIISSNNLQDTTWVSDKKEYSEEYVKTKEDGVLIEFKLEAIDKSVVESGQQNDTTGVRLGRGLSINDIQKVTDSKGNVIYEAKNNSQITPEQKQQAIQVYSQYLESLNKPNTNPILQGNQTNIEEIITQLEKEGSLEIDCKGKLKAEKGLATSFTKGSQWEIVKDLKGYPSHAQGGVDIKLGKDGFSFVRGEGVIKAAHGLVLPKIK